MGEPSTADRVAVVTGAAGGIGGAVVRRLVAQGFRVAALDLERGPLHERFGNAAAVTSLVVDVRDEDALVSAARVVEAELGPVYALVNNAGVFSRTPALSVDMKLVRRTLEVNLEGALAATSAFGKAMAVRRTGRIVNVASIAAHAGAALASAYAASKAGLVAVTQSHARELAPLGIAVNAVLPGYCETPMLDPSRALAEKFVVPRIPLRRFAEPMEIAEVVEMLVLLRTPYLTGAALPVDGGLHVG
jgi:2-hydroxycyclohexanecarboxyl-CoA dehydrogenase